MSEPLHPNSSAVWWRRVWTAFAVIAIGVITWFIAWGVHVQTIPRDAGADAIGMTGALMLLDIVLGIAAVGILPLRARHPLAIALLTTAALTFSATATGAAILAIVHLALIGSARGLIATGAVWLIAVVGNGVFFGAISHTTPGAAETTEIAAVAALIYLALVVVGRYRRARSETLRLLRERAENAERERTLEIQAAKENERLRIAREMHDVLAHRISLVSMHAGALAYRDDLPREKVSEAAHVIQESTALALTELRELLGVLRDSGEEDPRLPQPLLEHLPILIAETRAAGTAVELRFSGIDAADERPDTKGLNEVTSRTAYRIVQEALTNARKHSPGETVHLRVARSDGALVIESRNRLPRDKASDRAPAGMGLIGLEERAQLAGGTVTTRFCSGDFVLEGRLPWR